ncbi:hypothetical protein AVEN_7174-1 [Araneus ventricosus]|uniref:Uncharacterized protein n=1 Tax=Araneus ventricosus TaxID=182803 RepID=A0A4Y2GV29_ARAVE|nr:hypothetical protein AVEN_7174-1 [Araneus ventricosus]
MKLIRWVEVHIGRSRRKSKKEKDSITLGSDVQPRRKDESTPSTPLHKIEPIGKDLPRSAGSTPHRVKHPPSPHPLLRAPETPEIGGRLHIRTSFLDPGLSPLPTSHHQVAFGSSTALDSPRVRCRIRTNPWLPSPKNSALESGWTSNSGIRSSSIGSESSESISGSGFGSQSSGSLWEGFSGEPWGGFRSSGRSPSSNRLPRVTLERSGHRQRPVVEADRLSFYDEDTPYCPVTYCRPIPRSAWMNFRDLTTDLLEKTTVPPEDEGESSDEAYSEDYIHVEDQDELSLGVIRASKNSPPDTGSPQADSACGSDRDNSSCSTTPLSETPASSSVSRKSLAESKEMLQDKVHRLRRERHLVDQRMQEARAEEILRREEHLLLQRELVQFRRLLLLQTLSELRNQLEKQGKRFHRNYGGQLEGEENVNPEAGEET